MVVEVNHQRLRTLSEQIKSYCTEQDYEMRLAEMAMRELFGESWQGQDATALQTKWDAVYDSNSVAVKLRDSLKNFGEALDACANEYQYAQEEAYNKAALLPKILRW